MSLKGALSATYAGTKRLYQRYDAWKNRPPSPEETAEAQAHMRVALLHADKYLESNQKNPELLLIGLEPAAKALNRARRLDPNATVEVDERTQTQDQLAALLLYYEAYTLHAAAKHYQNASTNALANAPVNQGVAALQSGFATSEEYTRMAKASFKKALFPIQKAVAYEPDNLKYLQLHIRICRGLNKMFMGKRLYKQAIKLDPYDAETLSIKPRWF